MSGKVEVATSGSVPLSHKCEACGATMLYRVDRNDVPETMFCGNLDGCQLALWQMPLPSPERP